MKYIPHIAGALLGFLFVISAGIFLTGKAPQPEIPEGTPIWYFMQAFGPTGYMTFIKVIELVGGILVAIPKTRNLGLLALGPIILNILAFHTFVAGDGIFQPMLIGISALALYLLWAERRAFSGLVSRSREDSVS